MALPPSTTVPLNTVRTWTRDGFLISTDTSLIPIAALTEAFNSEQMYWAKGLSEHAMREMLSHSLCFGLYSPTPAPPCSQEPTDAGPTKGADSVADTPHEIAEYVRADGQPGRTSSTASPSPSTNLIGFARCITDHVTLVYLTDVFVASEWQGQGLGKWLVSCVQEVVADMPDLRRSLLLSSAAGAAKRFYGQLMGMDELGGSAVCLSAKGPGCTF
ncbi:uncharacterized protein A1O9_08858 [Exophiala aquamarina CBS 119918]|uniref:N-acetyltransferase domain-containing protein n=1 Tax=Exophiala aquamarina CBS 119918 TaxID=1182545 RepID=A0A072P519_9EURO|nr:uncharacterized protein A1O9_08858 [Exophiala aquamarina CBS 119918]KEF55204.1 hypothetical protein A1O9_08858 [Exophiala aquamarina CBS 119918]